MAVVCKILAVLLTALSVLPAYGKRLVEKLPPVSEIVTGYACGERCGSACARLLCMQ